MTIRAGGWQAGLGLSFTYLLLRLEWDPRWVWPLLSFSGGHT